MSSVKDIVVGKISARNLTADDAVYLRMIRLEALKFYGKDFDKLHDREILQPISYWEELAKGMDIGQFLGLYNDDELVGIMCTRIWEKDTSGKTAFWWGNFTLPQYRSRGIVKALYQHRIDWAEERGCNKAVAYVHGAHTARPVSILKKLGGVYTHTEMVKHGPCEPISCDWYTIPFPRALE